MKRTPAQNVLLWAAVPIMLVFCLGPFIWMVLVSFARDPDFLSSSGKSLELSLENYRSILSLESLHFPEYFRNSLIVAFATTVCSVIVASLAAYAVSRLDFPGRMLFPVIVLSLSMFPQICLVGYLFKLMTFLGWINSHVALIIPYIAWELPLSLWILLSYFAKIPLELDQAALVDGAGRLHILRRIIFPLAAPGILSTALLVFIFSFNEFLFALMLTTDHHARTIPVGIALFEGLHGEIPWGYLMAASTFASLPLVLLAVAFQRRIVQGLTAGAVK